MPSLKRPTALRRASARGLLLVSALTASLFSSCLGQSPAPSSSSLVPSGAIAALIVESPAKLYVEAEQLWTAAGLDASYGSDLATALLRSLPGATEARGSLDFERPWALAILPSTGAKRTRTLVYLPYRSSPEDAVRLFFGSSSWSVVADSKGYLVLSDEAGELEFPPAEGADLSRLSRYPAASIKLWGDPAAIRRATADRFKPIEAAIRSFLGDSGPAHLGGGPAAALFAQVGLAGGDIEPGRAGIILRAGVAAAPGSDLGRVLGAAALAHSALDWAPQLDSSALGGLAWSLDPALVSAIAVQALAPALPKLGLPREAARAFASLEGRWAKGAGSRGAVELYFEAEPSELSGAAGPGPGAEGGAAPRAASLRLRVDMVQELRNEAAYRAFVDGLPTDPEYRSFSRACAEVFGLSFRLENRDRNDGAFAYGELKPGMEIVEGAEHSGARPPLVSAATKATLAAFRSTAPYLWTVSGGRFAATNGDAAWLRSLVARKAAADSLTADPAFAAFAATIPPKPFVIASVSTRALARLLSRVAAPRGDATGSMGEPKHTGTWYGYLATTGRGLEAGLFVPASDLDLMIQTGGALLGRALAKGEK